MKFKLSFHDYKNVQRMSQKELSVWVKNVYESGYKDGRDADDVTDIETIKSKIKNVKGVGDVIYKKICDTLEQEK